MEYIQYISILLEVIITILFIKVALRGVTHVWGLALAFGIYVFYDLARELAWDVGAFTTWAFLVATLGALYAAHGMYKQR